MLCFSPSGTVKLMDTLSEDHDIEVMIWSDELKEGLQDVQDVNVCSTVSTL